MKEKKKIGKPLLSKDYEEDKDDIGPISCKADNSGFGVDSLQLENENKKDH